LNAFLKVYIKALQLASDMDNSVEEKLLIGDRPKPSSNPETSIPLAERLAMRKEDELNEVSTDNFLLFDSYSGSNPAYP
jgi:N-terminal acetyltransferase B complex non-catalytic subunit